MIAVVAAITVSFVAPCSFLLLLSWHNNMFCLQIFVSLLSLPIKLIFFKWKVFIAILLLLYMLPYTL